MSQDAPPTTITMPANPSRTARRRVRSDMPMEDSSSSTIGARIGVRDPPDHSAATALSYSRKKLRRLKWTDEHRVRLAPWSSPETHPHRECAAADPDSD